MQGRIVAVCTSTKKGVAKKNVGQAEARVNWGLVGDAHAADWHRQVSLLAIESIDKMRALGLKVRPGSFAENLTTQGIDLLALPIGSRVRVGDGVVLEITQHGKICHEKCAIYRAAGDCVMPREGIFARVIVGGMIREGDAIVTIGEEG
ncbi:MAG: MOSC domain-containing protein [Chloroflexi bacterium]|nr:MOSC domain-containing protein [Chloroflexota bacterium]